MLKLTLWCKLLRTEHECHETSSYCAQSSFEDAPASPSPTRGEKHTGTVSTSAGRQVKHISNARRVTHRERLDVSRAANETSSAVFLHKLEDLDKLPGIPRSEQRERRAEQRPCKEVFHVVPCDGFKGYVIEPTLKNNQDSNFA